AGWSGSGSTRRISPGPGWSGRAARRLRRRSDFLDDVEDRAAARHASAPDPVEIGGERLDDVGIDRRLARLDRGELVERDMHRRIAAAPAAPRPRRPERLAGPRQ